jgi:hypothetical protein
MSKSLVAALISLTFFAQAATAAPTTGRRENPSLPLAKSGVLAVAGLNTGVGYVAEIAPPEDVTAIKLMGDHLLNQPKGKYTLGLAEFEWRYGTGPKRIHSLVMWIDGDYQPDHLLPGFDIASADVEFCRAIGISYISDLQFTPGQLQSLFDDETPEAFPHHSPEMRKNRGWAEVIMNACKRRNSPKWAIIRGGNGIGGQDEWVFLGDYTPDNAETGRPVWVDIPNHRRSLPVLNRLRDRPYFPVNNYDAALAPTPGDTEGMKDIYPESRGK